MSEKLETYDKAQKTFLQNASHEFRTPLMSIQSYAEGIKYNIISEKEGVEIILDETKRMTHLVEDLLYLSRLDAIEELYDFETIDLNEMIFCCTDRVNNIAIKSNIVINVNAPSSAYKIKGDREKLERALINILSNCIRYAESKIEISFKPTEKKKIIIEISDDGPGFNKEEINSIFDRFYKGNKGNFGLGLAITKNIIEKHEGTIKAANLQPGALFIIELPLI